MIILKDPFEFFILVFREIDILLSMIFFPYLVKVNIKLRLSFYS